MKKFFLGSLIFFVLLAAGLPQQAIGGGWVLAGKSDDFAVYLDSDSAKMVSETTSKIWVKVVARSQRYKDGLLKFRKQKSLSVEGYQNYAYTLESLEFECSTDQQRTLETADYDNNDVRISQSFPLSNWRHLSPGTVAASIAVALCRQHAVSNTWWWDYPDHQSHDEN
ncbi:MAG: hypothetical protein K4571_06550 [Deltaproteobacteria bacterium]